MKNKSETPLPFPLPELPRIPSVEFNLRAFGAVEGGQVLNTAAFAAAIAAAHEAGGGRVVVPNGVWLTGPIHFKDRIELHLEAGAEIRFSQNPDDYLPVVLAQRGGTMLYNYSPLLYAYGCEDIALTGHGVLDGQGVAWWPWKFNQPGMKQILVDIPEKGIPLEQRVFGTREAGVRPVMCQPIECERVLIEGVTLRNSPSWTVQPVWCREVTLRGVTVSNPPSPFSYNTDGIDPDACRNVLIEHCDVSTGDDAITLKSGLGPDAWKDGRPLENVLIRHCRIGFGHGGITIGSDMSAGVRNVHAHDCEIDGVDRGIRIKSKPGRGGFVENIVVERVKMRRVAHAVDINLYYAGNREETLDIENLRHVPRFEHFVLRDITCESADHAVTLRGLPGYPLKDIRMENVEIRAVNSGCTEHVEGLVQENVHILPIVDPAWLRGDEALPEIAAARRVAARIEGPEMAFPAEKRPMAGRHTVAIAHADSAPPLRLFWDAAACPEGPAVLRFTVSVDHRCLHRVSAANAATGGILGECVVPFGCPGQACEIPLTAAQSVAALRDGVALSLADPAEPLWIIAPGPRAPDAVLPQLYFGGDAATEERFLNLFCSEATIQPWDWMEICVLDGLMDWTALGRVAACGALKQHLEVAFHPETGTRENFRGHPCDGQPSGPESTGPWAVFARTLGHNHQHPALALAEACFEKHYDPRTDSVGHQVVAETSYNIAYPMMAMARFTERPALQARALRQLEANREHLTGPDDLWLRYFPESGEKTFQNWSRGVAWYFLGLVRTLSLLPAPERPAGLCEEIGRVAQWTTRHQQADGLWPCFLKESGVLPDTSGSAGIAAAIALAVRHGMLGREHLATARRTRDALMKQLTPDGWLRGVSQVNKPEAAGMDLQRSTHRVIAPWGMGLFAQLLANLAGDTAD
jgi:hypothetical protein